MNHFYNERYIISIWQAQDEGGISMQMLLLRMKLEADELVRVDPVVEVSLQIVRGGSQKEVYHLFITAHQLLSLYNFLDVPWSSVGSLSRVLFLHFIIIIGKILMEQLGSLIIRI